MAGESFIERELAVGSVWDIRGMFAIVESNAHTVRIITEDKFPLTAADLQDYARRRRKKLAMERKRTKLDARA